MVRGIHVRVYVEKKIPFGRFILHVVGSNGRKSQKRAELEQQQAKALNSERGISVGGGGAGVLRSLRLSLRIPIRRKWSKKRGFSSNQRGKAGFTKFPILLQYSQKVKMRLFAKLEKSFRAILAPYKAISFLEEGCN